MSQEKLHTILTNFFASHHCEIEQISNDRMIVQLTEHLDKALMNRPFYWQYMKSTGSIGQPFKLKLYTGLDSNEKKDYDWIHFGNPRLQQIFSYLKQEERFTRLFEKVETDVRTALQPWLIINVKLSYTGKHRKEEIFSIGLNLMNGKMVTGMMDLLSKKSLEQQISDLCYPLSPLIQLGTGFNRVEQTLIQYLESKNHKWAEESIQTLHKEINQLQQFFPEADYEANEHYLKELQDLKDRFEPRIALHYLNAGQIYLTEKQEA